ncbi:MAG: AAA family ATPase [Armatimonadetes bacterium]|nr:AAA family ATPase [Armatimonadota bacterium]
MSLHEAAQTELDYQICSNRSLIYVGSHEEQRILDAIREVCASRATGGPWNLLSWDLGEGLQLLSGNLNIKNADAQDQVAVLRWFKELATDNTYTVLVLKDFHKFLGYDGHPGQTEHRVVRMLRNLVRDMVGDFKCIVLLAPVVFLPPELERHCAVIDWPFPEDTDIVSKVDSLVKAAKDNHEVAGKFQTEYTSEEMREAARAFSGLTLEQIQLLCTYMMLTAPKLDPATISAHKRMAIRKSTLLEWIDTSVGMAGVGGMAGVKQWLDRRKSAFSEEARAYGLPYPRGILVVGVQGCGKSLVAKAIASYVNQPLLGLDIGKVYSSLLGSSEQNIRTAIKTVESIAPCILWIDELEKGVGNGSSVSDGGTSSRVFSSFLTWAQERTAPVFIVATANDVSELPPELLRKGRFDEIFFVDLPDEQERKEIFDIHLQPVNMSLSDLEATQLLAKSTGFTGAEIQAAITEARYDAFSDNKRAITTTDLLSAMAETVPLSQTMSERITDLRNWAKTRARMASTTRENDFAERIATLHTTSPDDEEL